MTDLVIRMPWPPTEARPNYIRANHWTKYYRHIAAYRKAAWKLGLAANLHKMSWPDSDIELSYTFYPPKGCRWDRDAMSSAFKPGQDGLADAMKIDDARFNQKPTYESNGGAGCVVVKIITPCLSKLPIIGSIS